MRFRPAKKDADVPPPREWSFRTRLDCDYRHVESQYKNNQNRCEREQYYSFSSNTYNNNSTACQSGGGGTSEAKSVSGNFFNCPGGTN